MSNIHCMGRSESRAPSRTRRSLAGKTLRCALPINSLEALVLVLWPDPSKHAPYTEGRLCVFPLVREKHPLALLTPCLQLSCAGYNACRLAFLSQCRSGMGCPCLHCKFCIIKSAFFLVVGRRDWSNLKGAPCPENKVINQKYAFLSCALRAPNLTNSFHSKADTGLSSLMVAWCFSWLMRWLIVSVRRVVNNTY